MWELLIESYCRQGSVKQALQVGRQRKQHWRLDRGRRQNTAGQQADPHHKNNCPPRLRCALIDSFCVHIN